jgi:spoIIIJ-associated protein
MREIEKSAGSVEEAIESALEELGVSEQEAHIQILQEPRGGFLGLKAQPAVVRVRAVAAAPAPSPEPVSDEQAEVATVFLEGLLQAMGMDGEVEPAVTDAIHYVDIWAGEDAEGMGLLIGKHGHTLDSLQELVRNHVQRATGERCSVVVDVEDYRKRRRSHVARRAREAASRVRKTGRAEALEPMTAWERKVVHEAVGEFEGLQTVSEGVEPNRRVVIERAVGT